MWILAFITLLFITFLIGHSAKENFAQVLPVSVGGFILALYVLALCRNMNLIGALSVIFLVITLAAVLLMGKDGRKNLIKSLRVFFTEPQAIAVMFMLTALFVLTMNHVATWWDDVNFWATDAKALYFMNGFTGKYGNVAPEFGDYPPGVQIMKWCMAKICKTEYKEGLAFAGYYITNVIFCLPLLKKGSDKNLLINIVGVILLFLIPGIVNDTWSQGACADVTMGIVYGALLISIIDIDEHCSGFYYARILILLSVLTLTKSVGFEWAIYASVFLLLWNHLKKEEIVKLYGPNNKKHMLLCIVTAVSVQMSWWINCLINRRIAKLTSSGIHMVSGRYDMSGAAESKASQFIKGFVLCPMHTDKSLAIDLSSLTLVVITLLVIILLGVFGQITRNELRLLFIFDLITALLSYLIIFIGHATIFAGETQYDTPEVMAISISRYAAPFAIGIIMLLLFVVFEKCKNKYVLMLGAVFIILTTDYEAAYSTLIGYHASIEEDIANRDSMIDENGRIFAQNVRDRKDIWGSRLLYFRDDTVIHWVKDTYINHEVAPVAVVYTGLNPSTMGGEDIINQIYVNHASYVYMEDTTELEITNTMEAIMSEYMPDGEAFEYETVYKVDETNGKVTLIKDIK